MPGKPEFSVTDGTGNVFVNIEDTNQLLQIDVASMKVLIRFLQSTRTRANPGGGAVS
jgi:hypothetical protein